MNYIYDIVLNFNKEYYDFFEWDKKDKIINIRKTIALKLSEQDYLDFKYNKIKVSNNFLDLIYEKTILYFRDEKKEDYMCLVTDGKEVMGILFDKFGNILKRSGLIFDEADEVIDFCMDMNNTNVEYVVNEKRKKAPFIFRKEKDRRSDLIYFINKENDLEILKYLYYDYFESDCSDKEKIKETLLKEISCNWNEKHNNLCKLIYLTQNGNKKNV